MRSLVASASAETHPHRMLPWDDLRFVLAMARHGNASAAGRALGVNSSTVTRRVQALEEHLGVRLFDRVPGGSVPTDAGEAAVNAAKKMEQEVHGLDAEIRGLDADLRGTLRVSSMDIVFELWRKDLRAFRRQVPRVDLVLTSSNRPVDLSRREADVAVRITAAPPEHLVGRKLVEVFYGVYAAKRLIEEVHQERPDAGYIHYPWISWDEPYARATDRVIENHAAGADVRLRVSSMAFLGRSIEDGLGISVLPCFYGDRLDGVVRLGNYHEGRTFLWALTHEQLRRTARVRTFMDLVAKLVERDRDLFLGRTSQSLDHDQARA
ncbi:MAG: LysR family transcriptional regulator [Myxococcota bacterium]